MGDVKISARAVVRKTATRTSVRRSAAVRDTGPGKCNTARLLQPALKVGAANDPLEQEAEATADRVVSMSAPSLDGVTDPRNPGPSDARPAAVHEARRFPKIDQDSQPDTETFDGEPPIPGDHQDPDVAAGEDVDTAGLKHDEFAEIQSGEPDDPGEELRLAGDSAIVGAEGGDAPGEVNRAVAQPGAGRPLPLAVRSFMEPRFGVDFSDVRVHDGPADRRNAERIGARAFTHRNHIWMGEGESVDNRRLLAHELTHVVQQTRRAPAAGAQRLELSDEETEPAVQRGYLRNKAERIARNVPGYTLLSVILGKSPITGDRVPRTAENLVGGFLGLLPGGNLIFEKLKETRALQRAFDWVSTRLAELNITWSRIKGLISEFIDEMPAWSPLKIAKRIFKPLVQDIITFVREIKDKILEFIIRGALALAGSFGDRVWAVIEKARDTISLILNDPIGFAKNLIGAVVRGFRQFSANIWKHLKAGLMGWLFGTLQGMQIKLPAKLDFKGIISVALQILGLTYANFRGMLVKRLGTGGEKKVSYLEKSVAVVKILVKEGFLGIWQRLLQMIEGFKSTVIDGIRDFVTTSIVQGAVSWIAGLSNPVGAIIKIALSIYNMIKTFIERLDQIMDVAKSIFSSIGAIARGKVKDAADFIEKTIASTIPVFLAFVAALIPVNGITKTIRGIIDKLQKPVKRAMDKMVTFLVKKAKKLFAKILGKVNRKRKLPRQGFVVGKEPHELVPVKNGGKFTLEIASDNQRPADAVQNEMHTEAKKAAEYGDDSKCVDAFEKAFAVEVDEAQVALAKVKPEQQKKPTKHSADKATAETSDAASKLSKLGPCIADNPFLEDEPEDGAIIRAREPRIAAIEGDADLYTNRGNITSKTISSLGEKAGLGAKGQQRLSNYYENDHVPEKSLAFQVQKYTQGKLKQAIAEGQRDGTPVTEPYLGDIDSRAVGKKGEQLPAITIYRPTHLQKTADDAGRRDHAKIIADAEAESLPQDKIAKLRAGISTEMQAELENIAKLYSDDPAASKAIRGKVRKGMRMLGDLNKTLYGFEPGKAPTVKRGPAGASEGSSLPMEGDPASGLPDFADLEGAYAPHKEKPEGVGKYLEYDHIVEATLAEKSRVLDLSHPDISGGLDDAIAAGAEARGSPVKKDGQSDAAQPATVDEIKSRATQRIASLTGPVFAGKGVAEYERGAAGTVGLYRPVHRQVTAEQRGVQGDLLQKVDLSAAREKLVAYALSEPEDTGLRKQMIEGIQKGVSDRFEEAISKHSDSVKAAYQLEQKEFLAINSSKQAGPKMATIVARVDGTLKRLRAESLGLLK